MAAALAVRPRVHAARAARRDRGGRDRAPHRHVHRAARHVAPRRRPRARGRRRHRREPAARDVAHVDRPRRRRGGGAADRVAAHARRHQWRPRPRARLLRRHRRGCRARQPVGHQHQPRALPLRVDPHRHPRRRVDGDRDGCPHRGGDRGHRTGPPGRRARRGRGTRRRHPGHARSTPCSRCSPR